MAEKLHDYFVAGSRLVWYVYPQRPEVEVLTSGTSRRVVAPGQMLDGGDVLPGFEMSLTALFAELPGE